jgi:hypothetical protein
MAGNWVSKALGKTQAVDDFGDIPNSMTLLLILGRNTFGDEVYSYIRLPMKNIDDVKTQLSSGKNFVPSHFGTVVAAGRGKPTPAITEEVGIPEFVLHFKPDELPNQRQPQTTGGYR